MQRAGAIVRGRVPRRRIRSGGIALAMLATLLAACGRGIRQDTVRQLQGHTAASDAPEPKALFIKCSQ